MPALWRKTKPAAAETVAEGGVVCGAAQAL